MDDKDLIVKILEWKQKHENIFATTICDQMFVFRTLRRKEFTKIYEREDWTNEDKEEAFCEVATLYPEGFDFTDCIAGIPVVLTEKILSESLLLDDGKSKNILSKYRSDMRVYENQITCVITEAFPTIRLDEIEDWDMHKIFYYLSRAEYVLNKLRGLPIVSQEGEVYDSVEQYEQDNVPVNYQPQQYASPKQEEYYVQDDYTRDIDEFNGNAGRSMPNLKDLEALKAICPEIDWAKEDSLLNGTFNFEEESKLTFNAEDV